MHQIKCKKNIYETIINNLKYNGVYLIVDDCKCT